MPVKIVTGIRALVARASVIGHIVRVNFHARVRIPYYYKYSDASGSVALMRLLTECTAFMNCTRAFSLGSCEHTNFCAEISPLPSPPPPTSSSPHSQSPPTPPPHFRAALLTSTFAAHACVQFVVWASCLCVFVCSWILITQRRHNIHKTCLYVCMRCVCGGVLA